MIIPDCADDSAGLLLPIKFLLFRKLVDVYLFDCKGFFFVKDWAENVSRVLSMSPFQCCVMNISEAHSVSE